MVGYFLIKQALVLLWFFSIRALSQHAVDNFDLISMLVSLRRKTCILSDFHQWVRPINITLVTPQILQTNIL
jgi:hypothetical protein